MLLLRVKMMLVNTSAVSNIAENETLTDVHDLLGDNEDDLF